MCVCLCIYIYIYVCVCVCSKSYLFASWAEAMLVTKCPPSCSHPSWLRLVTVREGRLVNVDASCHALPFLFGRDGCMVSDAEAFRPELSEWSVDSGHPT